MRAQTLYTFGGPTLDNPGAGAAQDRFNRFTSNPLASIFGNGGINVMSLQTTRRSATVTPYPVINSLIGNGAVLQGQIWAQSLQDATALAANAVQG